MNQGMLASLLDRSETHRKILGDYAGAYSLGVTKVPRAAGVHGFLLRVEGDASRFPDHVTIDGETIPVIIKGGFAPPRPQ